MAQFSNTSLSPHQRAPITTNSTVCPPLHSRVGPNKRLKEKVMQDGTSEGKERTGEKSARICVRGAKFHWGKKKTRHLSRSPILPLASSILPFLTYLIHRFTVILMGRPGSHTKDVLGASGKRSMRSLTTDSKSPLQKAIRQEKLRSKYTTHLGTSYLLVGDSGEDEC